MKKDKKRNNTIFSGALTSLIIAWPMILSGAVPVCASYEIEIRDIKDVMGQNIVKDGHFLLTSSIIAVLVIILLMIFFKRTAEDSVSLSSGPKIEKPVIPAHITALAELEKLYNSGLIDKGAFREFYACVSRILRIYAGESLGFNCVDFDMGEIISNMNERNVKQKFIMVFTDLNSECDLVKFAKYNPDEFLARELYKNSVEFVKNSGGEGLL